MKRDRPRQGLEEAARARVGFGAGRLTLLLVDLALR
jgi:hypothetical protein